MERLRMDIVVSGGGVAGLAAAAAFGSAGFSVLCTDPEPPVTDGEAAGADLRTTALLQPSIPVLQAAEMTPIDPSVGEFRVHYAGFFDPGFGTEEAGGRGARGVLEVRTHDTPFLLEHGQTVARLVYEPLTERPARLYGQGGSHYQRQGLKLSKHFRAW